MAEVEKITVRAVVFDFDGTLCDSMRVGREILSSLREKYGFRKIADYSALQELSMSEAVKHLGIPRRKLPLLTWECRRRVHAYRDQLELFPDIGGVICRLRRSGIPVGVVTSNTEDLVRYVLGKADLVVDQVIAGVSLFGKATKLKSIFRQLGDPDEGGQCLYIGDETRDIEAARKAGIGAAAVSWGYNSVHALERWEPDFLFRSPKELGKRLCPE